jgi:defect-in-organelle-trafficking protein DotB
MERLKEKIAHKQISPFVAPAFWQPENFDEFLAWASEAGASDVVFKSGDYIHLRIDGEWVKASESFVNEDEIAMIVNKIAQSNSSAPMILNGNDMDFPHEIRIDRGVRRRFRCNATACAMRRSSGISLTLRTIPSVPPSIRDLGVEQGLLDYAFIDKGLVLVTGVMGSGKSTLLGGIIREIIETQPKHIITLEDPIEFDLSGIENKMALIEQTDVSRHIHGGFENAVRNTTRRAADIIWVGESRDPETLRSMLEAAEIGTGVYSTVHTRNVAETPSRIINVFPYEQQNQIATTLISSLRLIVQQRLLPRADKPGRIAIKEYLGFTPAIKKKLMETRIENLIPTLQEIVDNDGHSLLKDAEEKLKNGLIFEADYLQIANEMKI